VEDPQRKASQHSSPIRDFANHKMKAAVVALTMFTANAGDTLPPRSFLDVSAGPPVIGKCSFFFGCFRRCN
jgi:hypothetical protein